MDVVGNLDEILMEWWFQKLIFENNTRSEKIETTQYVFLKKFCLLFCEEKLVNGAVAGGVCRVKTGCFFF
jgi:hypothetical protein